MDAPAAAVSADGKRIALAWMAQPEGGKDVIWTVTTPRQLGRGTQRTIDDDRAGAQGHAALAIDGDGTTHAVWVSRNRIQYRTWKRDGTHSATRTVSRGGERAGQPALAARKQQVVLAYEVRGGAVVRRLR